MTLRNVLAHKARMVMSVLSIVLGVGFLAGVLTFDHGMRTTFDGIIEGSTSDAVVRPSSTRSFDDSSTASTRTLRPDVVRRLQALPQVARATGSVDSSSFFLLDRRRKLVGGNGPPTLVTNHTAARNIAGEPTMVLTRGSWPRRGEVVLDSSATERAGYRVGDTVHFISPLARTPVGSARLSGVGDFNGGGTAGAIVLTFDTGTAQRLILGGRDAFTSVNLTAAPGVSQRAVTRAARAVLPAGFSAVTGDKVVAESKQQVGRFLDVISQFLIVFALVAIVVGAFIIANTFTILVTQRVRELALLRALGAGRRQVTRSVLFEAFVMALVAATLGLLVGLGLARGLASVFSSQGLRIDGSRLSLTSATVLTSYAVGLVVTMVAAYLPARRASRIAPVAAMREDASLAESSLRRRGVIAILAALVGVGLAVLGLAGGPGNSTAWVGAAGGIWLLALASMSPVVGHPVLLAARAVFGRLLGTPGRLAGENALRNPRRTGATASALMIGLALVSLIGVLAASLNASADDLVDQQFTSDYLVSAGQFAAFPTAVGDRLAAVPGVGTLSRQQFVEGSVRGKDVFATAADPTYLRIARLAMVTGRATLRPGEALLSARQARELHLRTGKLVPLRPGGGDPVTLRVAGTYRRSRLVGRMLVPLSAVRSARIDRADNQVSILAAPGVDKKALGRRLDRAIRDIPVVSVQDKQDFAASIRGQIDGLLYLIYGLLGLAVVIAVIGIVNTLGLSVLERTREIGLLRAIGLSRPRLRRMVTVESVVIALLGAILGMALGLVIGVLVRQTLTDQLTSLRLPVDQLAIFAVLSVVVGVLAAVIPSIRASRMRVLDAIAHE